ncbi:MAG: UMP kinase [Candidatus Marinimicrobia bacterium]|nr:UMP kinase [Candidatus Neomarinimicrobiota bacterium]MCF7922230.1 UMP kinase [Candidatus Neomarinimicrobiota bacterium]
MSAGSIYKRILLKLSGESLAGDSALSIDTRVLDQITSDLQAVVDLGVQVGIVIGGGNIFRGLSQKAKNMNRVAADHMGMLATVINAVALGDAVKRKGMEASVLTAIEMNKIAAPFSQRKAIQDLSEGKIVIFAAGTGNPFFTTDTAAALRGVEIGADVLLKGTRVNGIYSADPEKDPNAIYLPRLSYNEVMNKNLRVMDQTAFALCRENNLAVHVFNMEIPGNLLKVIQGAAIGSVVGGTHAE